MVDVYAIFLYNKENYYEFSIPKEGFTTMAQYNHEILVQYLRDVYSLELLRNKMQGEVNRLHNQILQYKDVISRYQCRPFPVSEDVPEPKFDMAMFGYSCLFYMLSLFLFAIPWIGKFLGIGGLLFTFGLDILAYSDDSYSHKAKIERSQREFEKAVAEYESLQRYAAQCQTDLNRNVPTYNNMLSQLREVEKNLSDAYSVNIIPNRYRTIYAAYYLYDYFSSCQETDLDKIVQTMLLDQIITKLNRIINQQTEMILNQRMALAKQDEHMEQLQQNHNAQLRAMAQIEQNQALQTNYLDMLDTNTRITNFFVTADYINKYL